MNKVLKFLQWLILSFTISGCNTGIFFPVEVNDISQIRVQAYLFKDYIDGRERQRVRVRIRDKNDELIRIKNGKVHFHKWEVPFCDWLVSTTQYELEVYDKKLFYPDSTYKLTIMLTDNSKYYFYIHTPEKDLVAFNVPAEIDFGKAIDISWKEVCATNPSRVKIEFDYLENGKSKSKKLFLPIPIPAEGHFKIDWSNFAPFTGLRDVKLELYYETEGSLDPRLLDNSYLRAQYKMHQYVLINTN